MSTNYALKQKRRWGNFVGDYTVKDWERICKHFHNRCVKCHKFLPNPTIDHIIPLSKGGKDLKANIQPMCVQCNSSKSDNVADYRKEFEDWWNKNQCH